MLQYFSFFYLNLIKKREFWNLEIKLKVFNNFFQCFSILCLVLHSKLAALKIFYPEKTTWQAIDWIKKSLHWKNNHNFGDEFNISDWTLYSLPWCSFVLNFHKSFRAKNWSMTTDEHVKSEFLFEETKRELLRLS